MKQKLETNAVLWYTNVVSKRDSLYGIEQNDDFVYIIFS